MRPCWAIAILLPALGGCATVPKPTAAAPTPPPCMQTGAASWYRPKASGQATAAGEAPASDRLVAAHPTLPFGTMVRVTELSSGKSVVVRIDDRGPSTKGRIIDLSPAAARQLGMQQDGVAQVRLEIYQPSTQGGAVTPASATGASCPFDKDTAA